MVGWKVWGNWQRELFQGPGASPGALLSVWGLTQGAFLWCSIDQAKISRRLRGVEVQPGDNLGCTSDGADVMQDPSS